MRLEGFPFEQTFTFVRPIEAPYRNAQGVVVLATFDEPRIDHDLGGIRLGLLVDGGQTLGQADRCAVIVGDWEVVGPATVLHEFAKDDGTIVRRAFYTQQCRTMVNAVLRVKGHHRIIGAVPGFLRNAQGKVRYREREWLLPAGLGTGVEGQQLEDGTPEHRLLVEA